MNRKKISFGFPMLSILLVVGVMFAACGGDDDDDSEAGSSEAGAEPATASDIEGDWQLRSYAESGADDLDRGVDRIAGNGDVRGGRRQRHDGMQQLQRFVRAR